jgi:uncharacterized protein YegJ (DUF2314 family)
MPMPSRRALAVLLLCLPFACDDAPTGRGGPATRAANTVAVADDDAAMNAAVAKARETLPQFVAALKSPTPAQRDFAIKAGFAEGDAVEYMSVTAVRPEGAGFRGTLNNDPTALRNVKRGDEVTVGPDRVVDWSYVEDGKLVGGHTLRVLRERMTPEQRKEFDAASPFRIE